MRIELLTYLRCPVDLEELSLADGAVSGPDGHILEGNLVCRQCGEKYPVSGGVPYMLPPEGISVLDGADLFRLKKQTISRFGFEWQYFNDWGWIDEYPDEPNAEITYLGGLREHTTRAFWSKSLFEKEDIIPGRLLLDGGCGNGRFTNEAAREGAEVIGLDLGWGVFSAFEHTRGLPNVHIVRGDLFHLPFPDKLFDGIFSIGVLQHTGDASRAFDSLVRKLKENGKITAHVYGRGLPSYELIDGIIRAITTRLPIGMQMGFSKACALFALSLKKHSSRLFQYFYRHINLLPTVHHMFDWWSAPIATHHTPQEVTAWFVRNNLRIITAKPPQGAEFSEKFRRDNHGSITIHARRIT